jgi:lipopolysaccharide biosynthesis glycosyltransferase
MNIVVTLNANYIRPLCVMLRSLIEAHPARRICVYVIHSSLEKAHFDFVRQTLCALTFDLRDIHVDESFLSDAPVPFHFSKEMYYRLFAAKLLPPDVSRALYLDPDMVVLSPLESLYDMDLGERFFAAARSINVVSEATFKVRLKMPVDSGYFNSGVLLMNLDALRRRQQTGDVLRYIDENRRRLVLPDQDVLNALYNAQTVLVDPLRYNFDARYYPFLHTASGGQISLERMPVSTCIIHYCASKSPGMRIIAEKSACFISCLPYGRLA